MSAKALRITPVDGEKVEITYPVVKAIQNLGRRVTKAELQQLKSNPDSWRELVTQPGVTA